MNNNYIGVICHLVVFLSVLFSGLSGTQTLKGVAQGPQNDARTIGESVILQCESTGGTSWIVWIEYATGTPFGLPVSDNENILAGHPNAKRYAILHDDATSYDLLINSSLLEDGGKYKCLDAELPDTELAYAELIMMDGEPTCYGSGAIDGEVIEGHVYSYQCSVDYQGNVPPTITWTGPQPFTIETTTTNQTASSKVTFTAALSLDGSHFMGQINFTAAGFGGADTATNVPTYEYFYHGATLTVYTTTCSGQSPTTVPPPVTGTLMQQSDGSNGAFNKSWSVFKSQFSGPNVFWLGNEAIHELTMSGDCGVRFELQAEFNSLWYVAAYSTFIVGNESSGYQLTVSGYSGNASDAMAYYNGMKFSTYDQDNDAAPQHCGAIFGGAWWYRGCYVGNLITLPASVADGFGWYGLPPPNDNIIASRVWLTCSADQSTTPSLSTPTTAEPSLGTTLMQESDGTDNAFNKSWSEFKNQFSGPNVFWLGNEAIHALTMNGNCGARFELHAESNSLWYVAEYRRFIVGNESTGYQLTVSGYTGNASDAMAYYNGMKFSTYDQDYDVIDPDHCGASFGGAWWYNDCYLGHLITLPKSLSAGFGWHGLPTPSDNTISTRVYLLCN